MYIKKIKLQNFRNYICQEVDFNEFTNIIVGKNAQGKTNLIEPIYLLSTFKSFRNSKLVDCINEDAVQAVIEVVVESDIYGQRNVKLVINKDGENEFYVNDNKINSKKEMYGFVFSVVFSPDELRIIKGGPETRREFLDIDIAQVSKIYVDLLDRYDEILANRNKLLKSHQFIKNVDIQLDVWDNQLAMIGSQISTTRSNFVKKINLKIENIIKFLSGGKEELKIKLITLPGETREDKTNNFLNLLLENRQRDKDLGYTTIGPHRDEIKFYINKKEVKPFASQGQQRTVVLALKLAELETIKEEKECPILLLDDVFSELDGTRQYALLKYLENQQIFITSTFARTKNLNSYKKIRIENGEVKKIKE